MVREKARLASVNQFRFPLIARDKGTCASNVGIDSASSLGLRCLTLEYEEYVTSLPACSQLNLSRHPLSLHSKSISDYTNQIEIQSKARGM
jgi:hypothetical protein